MHITVKLILIFSFFIASAWDIRARRIPDAIHLINTAAGVMNIISGGIAFWDAITGAAIILILCLLIIFSADVLGGGDYKMIVSATFAVGIHCGLNGLCIAFLLTGLYALARKVLKPHEKGGVIPLAPFLSVGYMTMML